MQYVSPETFHASNNPACPAAVRDHRPQQQVSARDAPIFFCESFEAFSVRFSESIVVPKQRVPFSLRLSGGTK